MKVLMARRGTVFVVALGLLVSVTGCSTPTQGQPTTPDNAPTTTTTSQPRSTTSSARPTTSSKPDGKGPLAGKLPCSLLTDAERAQLQLKSTPKEQDYGDRRQCQFSENGFLAGVNIYDNSDLDSVRAVNTDVKPVPAVGRHKAIRSTFGGLCVISIEVTATSLAETTGGDIDGDMKKACDIAMRTAQIIEPKLP